MRRKGAQKVLEQRRAWSDSRERDQERQRAKNNERWRRGVATTTKQKIEGDRICPSSSFFWSKSACLSPRPLSFHATQAHDLLCCCETMKELGLIQWRTRTQENKSRVFFPLREISSRDKNEKKKNDPCVLASLCSRLALFPALSPKFPIRKNKKKVPSPTPPGRRTSSSPPCPCLSTSGPRGAGPAA